MKRKIIAILNYRSSKGILNVGNLLEKAGRKGKIHPKDWERASGIFRSLTIYDDGSCLLHSLSAGSMIRRMELIRW